MGRAYRFKAKVWLYPGQVANWHFITLPKKESAAIKELRGARTKGWGSLPVTVRLGHTSWDTSIFPDKKAGAYLLPLKAAVRKKEEIEVGDVVSFSLTLR